MNKLIWLFFIFLLVASPTTFCQPKEMMPHSKPIIGSAPASFGSTHFIVGYTGDVAQKTTADIGNTESTTDILFSPDDNIREQLLQLIKEEQKAIKVAAFSFTDQQLMDGLCDAHARGVKVEIISDPSSLQDKNSKIIPLCNKKIPIYIYNPQYTRAHGPSCMHHKFIIFEENKKKESIVWTGSLNLTRAACERNQENVLIVRDTKTVKKFSQQFEHLKKRAKRHIDS
jgi:phosphatidylserine/phosphatidylglycerophosphate/cardiolipin synthase-like enzyme